MDYFDIEDPAIPPGFNLEAMEYPSDSFRLGALRKPLKRDSTGFVNMEESLAVLDDLIEQQDMLAKLYAARKYYGDDVITGSGYTIEENIKATEQSLRENYKTLKVNEDADGHFLEKVFQEDLRMIQRNAEAMIKTKGRS